MPEIASDSLFRDEVKKCAEQQYCHHASPGHMGRVKDVVHLWLIMDVSKMLIYQLQRVLMFGLQTGTLPGTCLYLLSNFLK